MSRRRRMVLGIALSVLVLFGGTILLPARSWFGQRSQLASAEAQLRQLDAANSKLAARIEDLSRDDTVERQARELYGFVYPGQESYTVPPRGAPKISLPAVWPFDRLTDPLTRAAQRRAVPEDQIAR